MKKNDLGRFGNENLSAQDQKWTREWSGIDARTTFECDVRDTSDGDEHKNS